VEMTETANILNRATEKSFIIFDEIGRGTATYDGMAIAQSVLEFIDSLRPRTLFATHYHELTLLSQCSPKSETGNRKLENVKNLTVQVKEHNNEIIFMHKVVPGTAESSYGIHVAKMAGMPVSVIESAERILKGLENNVGAGSSRPTDCAGAEAAPLQEPVVIPGTEEPSIVKSKIEEPAKKPQLSLFDL
ncbi:MAG: DNA mismatch repair protein MutS, partial [Alphaproteobacteria bacterium]|nr:DNA mismatch repair protein MutS [Alphaproteobacteria bacterium]